MRPIAAIQDSAKSHARTAVAFVALIALLILCGVFGSPAPTQFDHATWVKHHGPREAMLTDLLRQICPGTSYTRVRSLLGTPDEEFAYPPGSPPTLEYDVGAFGLFYIDFKGTRGHYTLYYVSPPPSAGDVYPATGCWS